MKFSVWPSSSRTTDEVLAMARTADAAGWFGFWFADHYMDNTGNESTKSGDVHEVWSILPAVAAVTESVRIGPLVSPTSIHHPAILANRATTIDHISHGRFVLGLGAGWQVNEHQAYGIDLEEPKVRVDRFEESIQIVRSLLDEDRTTFEGTHYSIADAPSDPSPVQATLPILVGTSGPRMCRITARHAQEWNTWGSPEIAEEKLGVFSNACARVDVDIATKHTTAQAMFAFTEDQAKIDELEEGPMSENIIVGSDEHIIDTVGRYAALGFDELIVPDFIFGESEGERRESYERFTANVIPNFA